MNNLLEDAYDLHVHPGPDLNNRKADDLELAERYLNAGMKGFCIKSHYFSSAARARHINKLYPGINCIGALVLNGTVGGINPEAVFVAAMEGAKIIWFPTFDAENEISYTFGPACTYEVLPGWVRILKEKEKMGLSTKGISILEDGELIPQVRDIIAIAKERDLVLCTGHLGKAEGFALVKAAKEEHLQRPVVVTHATFCSEAYTKEEQKALADLGAMIEQCFGAITVPYGMTWDGIYEIIRFVGPENCIISSDCGHPKKDYPDVGMRIFAENLYANGFSEESIHRMFAVNPASLVE
jgi:hypothetical protein